MEEEIDNKREKLVESLKKISNKWIYLILAFLIWLGTFIRLRNLPLLKDSSGNYLVTDLDPFLYYRYAKYILEHGRIFATDFMRYVPLGLPMTQESPLLSYVIVYLYKFLHFFDRSVTLAFANVLYPVIFFILSMIVFYFLVRRFFNFKIALLSTAFLIVIPSFLYRTMAGVADKDVLAIFFMFCAFYLYVVGWQSKKWKTIILMGLLSGIATGLMGLVWGGVKFALMIFVGVAFIEFFLGKFKKKDFYLYLAWLIPTVIFLSFFSGRYNGFFGLMQSFTSALIFIVPVLFIVDIFISRTKIVKENLGKKLPTNILSLIVTFIIIFLGVMVLFGPSFIVEQVGEIKTGLLHPLGTNRFAVTVSENNQPYFASNWWGEYKWFFYFFLIGSILLFYNLVNGLGNKYKWKFTVAYTLFISLFIFSRYSNNSVLDGASTLSKFLYFGSLIGFLAYILFNYLYMFSKDKGSFEKFKEFNREAVFIFVWFVLMVVAARGAIRLLFVFSPIIAILASYFFLEMYNISLKFKENAYKFTLIAILLLLLFAPFVAGSWTNFTMSSANTAKYIGRDYDPWWADAMSWVKENTPKDAVFAHWWDYGYWVQTRGERATVLDGGNKIMWWDHFMGRHVLTGQSEEEALEFLITHNATHFLVDPSDIGKYTAYSSIGSDESYDRVSYIPMFALDTSQVQESRNETIYLYQGQFGLDEDFVYQDRLFPKGDSFVAGFFLPVRQEGENTLLSQPTAVLFYNGQRFDVPLECVYIGTERRYFDQEGLKGCLRIVPSIKTDGTVDNPLAAAFYVSERVSRTVFAKLYLFNEPSDYFKVVYSDRPFVVYSGRFIGPLVIWEISYPSNIKPNPAYLEDEVPDWFKII